MPNRLAGEKSPYLLQHADNPVDWYPWGSEAFEKARREDKPVLVSIGYSACHWCHVMEHESFEDERVADQMRRDFVSIKVDREERPDVDAIYMEALQALTGQGGWPLNVFLLPDGRPFYGGTYFPPRPGRGMASWSQVLESVAAAYRERTEDVNNNAEALTAYLQQSQHLAVSDAELTPDLLQTAYDRASESFDWNQGGFGGAPKFPQPLSLEFILRMHRRLGRQDAADFLNVTLHKMAEGGIYDHVGGGFHRYTVDGRWVVPHFEKMLYDNALLARVFLLAFQLTHDPLYRSVVEGVLNYLLRDMQSPDGGFYSAEDADSEGVEGKFYVWTPAELEEALGPHAARIVTAHFGVEPEGNFEGKSILTVRQSVEDTARQVSEAPSAISDVLSAAMTTLFDVRAQRVPPGKDTKVLASWNGLAIRSLAEAGRVLGRPDYTIAAKRAASFILESLQQNGRFVRSYRDGPSDIPAFLEDYAFVSEGLISLYETTGETAYLHEAERFVHEMHSLFWDDKRGMYFDAAQDSSQLVVRPRTIFDNPIPSGNSSAAFALLRLHALTGRRQYEERALPAFRTTLELIPRAPLGFGYLLCALDFHLSPQTQIAIVGERDDPRTEAMLDAVYARYLPHAVVAVGHADEIPLLEGRKRLNDKTTAYVCEDFTCRLPVTEPEELILQLEQRKNA